MIQLLQCGYIELLSEGEGGGGGWCSHERANVQLMPSTDFRSPMQDNLVKVLEIGQPLAYLCACTPGRMFTTEMWDKVFATRSPRCEGWKRFSSANGGVKCHSLA